jgi:glycosyltransferase involved in cell wall biosynthesis
LKPNTTLACLVNSCLSRPFTKLYLLSDGADWVLSWEIRETARIAASLGICQEVINTTAVFNQCVFYADKRVLLHPYRTLYGRRVAFPYFHGDPSSGDPTSIAYFNGLRRLHPHISRIQVSHSRMRDLVLESGIAADKVHLIPIAVNDTLFTASNSAKKRFARERFGVPKSAFVVGSFQKDGVGWGKGMQPKWIKGPDVFLAAVARMKAEVPELFVLLSGPARGFVKQGLTELGVPFKHIYLKNYQDVGELFHCLDLYIIASREEGGPKAVLEAMASSVPLVTACVGQAMDLVVHGENGYVAEVGDSDALAHWAIAVARDTAVQQRLCEAGLRVAKANTYEAHTPLWHEFFRGFVQF